MARLVIPSGFVTQTELFNKIKAKVDADGLTGELVYFLMQKNINLANDAIKVQNALLAHDKGSDYAHEAEAATKARNLLANPVKAKVKAIYQFLKALLKPNYGLVGEWGAFITTDGRISYPADFLDYYEMFKDLDAKYSSYSGSTTPIDPKLAKLNVTMTLLNNSMAAAKVQHDLSLEKRNYKEQAYAERDLEMEPVLANIREIGNFLMELHADNPKLLGFYGFTVDDSPRPPKERISRIPLLSSLTINSIKIGSVLKNLGTVPVYVYKGSTVSGTPSTVLPGQDLGIAKGMSTLTINNTDPTTEAVVSSVVS